MNRISVILVLALFSLNQLWADQYNVLDYGAVKDTTRLSTVAFQKAIDACHASGGGVVYIPAGHYLSGTVWLKSNVSLNIERGATVFASKNPADYQRRSHGAGDAKTVNILIGAYDCENIGIYGGGTLDGQGARDQYRRHADYDPLEPITGREIANADKYGADYRTKYRRREPCPSLVNITGCRNVTVEGIRLIEAGFWTFHLQWCRQVFVRGVYIRSNSDNAVNSDGLDIDGCQQVVVSDCIIDTGDDALCLKTTRNEEKTMPCEDITITNCILRSSSAALKLGTESHADFRRIVVSNCVINGANRGLNMIIRDGGNVSDVLFSNLTVHTERKATFWWGNGDPIWLIVAKRPEAATAGSIRNVTFHNIHANGMSGIRFEGFDNTIENIKLNNVNLYMEHENAIDKRSRHGFHFYNVKNLTLTQCEVWWNRDNPETVWDKAFNFEKIENLYLDKLRANPAPGRKEAIGLKDVKGDFVNETYVEPKKR